ncbi:MAG: class I SAM-dependent methyltransferase [Thermoproteales archaeon]|nr:class I SAM-dependent methyltransferase [Thermoproteales archaeon]
MGRHHKFLRENGFEIYGVDSSRELIRLAKEKNKNFENFYKVGDMRRIDYSAEFDVVLNWYTSFGYFSDKENKLVLENIYKAKLKLILTIYPPHILKSMLKTMGFKILYVFANHGIINVRNFDLTDLVERGVRRLVWIAYK